MIRQLREIPCRMLAHILVLHVRALSVFGKKYDAVCDFLAFFCAVLRFSDPPYAPLVIAFVKDFIIFHSRERIQKYLDSPEACGRKSYLKKKGADSKISVYVFDGALKGSSHWDRFFYASPAR